MTLSTRLFLAIPRFSSKIFRLLRLISTHLSFIIRDINNSVSRCIRPAIDAIRSNVCANDPSLYETMETVYKAVANSATYLRSSFNMQGEFCEFRCANIELACQNFKGLMQEGLPECFVRRPGRQIAKCFPGRSGYGRSRDYLSYHVGDQLFNSANCRFLRPAHFNETKL